VANGSFPPVLLPDRVALSVFRASAQTASTRTSTTPASFSGFSGRTPNASPSNSRAAVKPSRGAGDPGAAPALVRRSRCLQRLPVATALQTCHPPETRLREVADRNCQALGPNPVQQLVRGPQGGFPVEVKREMAVLRVGMAGDSGERAVTPLAVVKALA
jgi:hypothetical protein